MSIQITHRKGSFDSGHRVMNEKMKCFNLHGHTYIFTLHFAYEELDEIGYAIDFKEIKRVGLQWIDDMLDHGMILNPEDELLIETTKKYNSKLWLMSLNGEGKYCNPSAENISKEIFLAMEVLFDEMYKGAPTALRIHKVELMETPNCGVVCTRSSITENQRKNFMQARYDELLSYAAEKGVMEYDDRKDSSLDYEPFTDI